MITVGQLSELSDCSHCQTLSEDDPPTSRQTGLETVESTNKKAVGELLAQPVAA